MCGGSEVIESLDEQSASSLILQQRVPAGFSALDREHQWHPCPAADSVDVTKDSPSTALEKAQALIHMGPDRRDMEYRVVLMTTSRKGWVLL